jgi:pimeloyl-ACP methyl ester carboxylesterase
MATTIKMDSEGNGHTLLCLHGLGGRGHWFQGLSQRMRDRFRVIRLDLPGTGQNREGLSPFTAENCLKALAGLIESLPGPLTLVGQSMGTIFALKLQERMPGRFHSLVCVGGLPEIIPTIRLRLSERRERIMQSGLQGLGLAAAKGVFAKATFERLPGLIAEFISDFEALSQDEYVEGLDILLSTSATSAVPAAQIPCLVLSGIEDTYAPPLAVTPFASSLPGPVTRVEIPDCGHMAFLEKVDVFSEKIAEFLNSSQP